MQSFVAGNHNLICFCTNRKTQYSYFATVVLQLTSVCLAAVLYEMFTQVMKYVECIHSQRSKCGVPKRVYAPHLPRDRRTQN